MDKSPVTMYFSHQCVAVRMRQDFMGVGARLGLQWTEGGVSATGLAFLPSASRKLLSRYVKTVFRY